MDCVESAVRLGAKDVYLVYRRSYAQMPAEADERVEALEAGVHYLLLNQPVDYVADDSGRISGIRLVRTRLGRSRRLRAQKPGADREFRVGAGCRPGGRGHRQPGAG